MRASSIYCSRATLGRSPAAEAAAKRIGRAFAACVAEGARRGDHVVDVGAAVVGKGLRVAQPAIDDSRADVVRGQRQAHVAVVAAHHAREVATTRRDVEVRIEGRVLAAQLTGELAAGARHDLHQAARALLAECARLEPALDPDDAVDDVRRQPVLARRRVHVRLHALDARQLVVAERAQRGRRFARQVGRSTHQRVAARAGRAANRDVADRIVERLEPRGARLPAGDLAADL